jgi:hypothetical protein
MPRTNYPVGYSGQAINLIAATAHAANVAYCAAQGDFSHKSWESSPAELRDSVVDGVCFHIENADAGAQASHENWLKFKKEDGWTYGPIKSFEDKTHPCFMPFAELPIEQQAKDILFRNIVHSLAPAARVIFP